MKALTISSFFVSFDDSIQKVVDLMHMIMKTIDDQKMLTVLDSGIHVCVASQSVISACNFRVRQ